jgi:aryl-alcohol dehydrogenase-like predicted oxidoreductase
LKVSAVSYGNWVTHSQGREDQATACIRAALEAGITTFDTADVYANGGAETILGDALSGERREGLEILTKVFGATGPGGPNDSGLSRKHIHESINASLTRLRTDYVDLYQAHRYDFSTPLEETMEAFADVVRAGKVLYIGVRSGRPSSCGLVTRWPGNCGSRSSPTSPSTTPSTGSSSHRWSPPAGNLESARSASPRSSRAS